MILEILGRPPEHIKEALNTITVRLGAEKGVEVLEKKIHDVIPVKESKDLFSTFAELTIEIGSLQHLFGIIFAYMPSNIEITHPEKIDIGNDDLNSLISALAQRLHTYDAVTKKALTDKDILLKKLSEVAPKLFKKEALPRIRENKTLKEMKENPVKKKVKKKTKKKKK